MKAIKWKTWQVLVAAFVGMILGFALGSTSPDDEQVTAAGSGGIAQVTVTEPAATAPAVPVTAATTTAPPERADLVTFSGSSDKTTESFSVASPWKLVWTIEGGAGVGIEILTESGNRVEYLSTDPGSDETIIRRACTCYLEISPYGSGYTITVNGVPL